MPKRAASRKWSHAMPFAKNNLFCIRGDNRQANRQAKPPNAKSKYLSLRFFFATKEAPESRKLPAEGRLPCFLLSSLNLQSGEKLTYSENVWSRIRRVQADCVSTRGFGGVSNAGRKPKARRRAREAATSSAPHFR